MNEDQIRGALKSLRVPLKGLLSKDEIPVKSTPGNYIINLEDRYAGPGTHWVAAKIYSNGKGVYFDPYGFPPPQSVKQWLGAGQQWNEDRIQDNNSGYCGEFSVYGLYLLHKGYSLEDIGDLFYHGMYIDETVNDKILKKWWQSRKLLHGRMPN